MLFNSLQFAVFFPAVVILYFLAGRQFRIPLLLIASCYFYMAFIPVYILILALTIVVDYLAGLYLGNNTAPFRKPVLIISLITTCAILFVFKYFYFFTDTVVAMAGFFGADVKSPAIKIILPIGLSFHTFQSLSYVIEVYQGKQPAERRFLTYATYVMFFPQLVAGPIERPQNLIHQFYEHHTFEYDRVVSGLKRMAWGFFKKLVVADRLALLVNDVYGAPQNYNGLQLTLATVFFAFQIYCDFSGYSDIAIGSARVLGFKLMENFQTPYGARSISEFWHRWHVSLSTWFRDYVYIPLGGSRVGPTRTQLNLLLVFGISGLWHGASWNYVIWGLLNGLYLIGGNVTRGWREHAWSYAGLESPHPFRSVIGIACTFSLTCLAWILFRAASLPDAWYIFTHLASGWSIQSLATENFLLRQYPVALASVALLLLGEYALTHFPVRHRFSQLQLPVRWLIYSSAVLFVALFGVFRHGQFIYFQF